MQGEECCSETCGEGRGGLGDAALGSCELGGEAAQEVVFGLLGGQLGYGRQNSERICGQEDDLGGVAGLRYRLNYILDVVDRVGYTGIFGYALVCEIDLAVCIYGDVLKEGVTADGVVDVRFVLLGEVDDLGVAAAFVVEYSVIVPAVLVVTDKTAFGVCRKGCLAGS